MADSELRAKGKQIFEDVTQVPAFEPSDPFTAANLDQCFGALWSRPGLTRRERRFLSLATVGARGMDQEVMFHVRGALKSGDISSAEMIEIILHVTQYAGWPCGAVMYRHYRDVCEDLGLEVPGPDES
ncbi:MAG: carboxymuconolactone decarboxylase family protein [Myxococcales bacterium]|nr:carboxymuconolactone decarboxylase family protein [Myxococcales bacterium]